MSKKSGRFADAVVLAAGSSQRMRGRDKLFLEVAGLPLIAWTVQAVASAKTVRRIILVSRPDRVDLMRDASWVQEVGATVVAGGSRRQDSVALGVAEADGEVVLIHDGARPLVTPKVVDRVARAARKHGAAVPVAEVPESMRRVIDGRIVGIIDRIDLFRSQTPHGARRELLLEAYRRQDPHGLPTFIDETTLVQSTGFTVTPVKGDPANLKVTLRGDAPLALALLEARACWGASIESE
jgi:2-C-methyl-D-erythritol 4-phosphate cytidylyltransferase